MSKSRWAETLQIKKTHNNKKKHVFYGVTQTKLQTRRNSFLRPPHASSKSDAQEEWSLARVHPHGQSEGKRSERKRPQRRGGLSSGWSLIVSFIWGGLSSTWSLIRVFSYQGGLSSTVVSHLGFFHGLSSGWSLIRVISQLEWSLIWGYFFMVSHQGTRGGLSSRWSLTRRGLLSGWSQIRVVSHQEWYLSSPTPFLLRSCVRFCLYGLFNCISFHKFSWQLALSHSVLPVSFLPYWSFQLYISLWKSPSALI